MIGPLMILDLPTTNNKYITSNITKVIKQKTNILPKKTLKNPSDQNFFDHPLHVQKKCSPCSPQISQPGDFSFWGPRHRDLTHDPTVPRVEAWGMIGPPRQCPSHPSLPSLRALGWRDGNVMVPRCPLEPLPDMTTKTGPPPNKIWSEINGSQNHKEVKIQTWKSTFKKKHTKYIPYIYICT